MRERAILTREVIEALRTQPIEVRPAGMLAVLLERLDAIEGKLDALRADLVKRGSL